MIEFLKQLPHLEPYGTPVYFIYLIGALLPIFVGSSLRSVSQFMKPWSASPLLF